MFYTLCSVLQFVIVFLTCEMRNSGSVSLRNPCEQIITDWKESSYEHMAKKETSELLTWGPGKGTGNPQET